MKRKTGRNCGIFKYVGFRKAYIFKCDIYQSREPMMNKWLQCILCFGLLLLLGACTGPLEEHPPAVRVPPGQDIAGLKIITEDGGHLAWSKKTNQIAFDRLGKDGYFDLWLMNPDGSGQKCLTSNHPLLPNKHIGQPAWQPKSEETMSTHFRSRGRGGWSDSTNSTSEAGSSSRIRAT